jgi:predicted RecB family nuclease
MTPTIPITAAMLYDLVQCSHRVTMDNFSDPTKRDQVSPFVQLLWDRGTSFEQEVIGQLKLPFLNLHIYAGAEKERRTREAMDRQEPLIYGGRISFGDLLGDPDLLRLEDDGYIAGDIKSGSGEEGGSDDDDDEGKPKAHYAVQLALYTDVLSRLELSAGRRAFVWDVHGEEVPYDFDESFGTKKPTTLWHKYADALAKARAVVGKTENTLPAFSSICKNCVWYSACVSELEKADDLTLIPFLGRSKRDVMIDRIATVHDLAASNPDAFINKKKTDFPSIGPNSLRQFHARAQLLSTKGSQPYLTAPVSLPASDHELFFDIEVDPMRDVCYLHGFVERRNGDDATERFVYFLAETPDAAEEERAFKGAWEYMKAAPAAAIYYYSKYERSIYRKLRAKYPSVCSADEIEQLFDPSRAVDLYYDVVRKATEWPTRDFSLKTLAKFLGFKWRDTHPSGAASIEWYNRWVETGDKGIRQKILDYNEDDCRATRVLLDGVRSLTLPNPGQNSS